MIDGTSGSQGQYSTPLESRTVLSASGESWPILVKRDDLDPLALGGNKARKLRAIVRSSQGLGSSHALLTCGGTQSNHCRVAALVAAQNGWACSVVLHGEPDELDCPRGNLLLMLLAGAEVVVVRPNEISAALDTQEQSLIARGYSVKRIQGGGHEPLGAMAYAHAVDELVAQTRSLFGAEPRTILVCSGTGTTQGGILAGVQRLGLQCGVIGVSVGRTRERGVVSVEEAFHWVMGPETRQSSVGVDLRDDWLDGGYGKWTTATLQAVKRFTRETGIPVDPTYVGKAVRAMYDLLETSPRDVAAPVVLWHTGSIPVLMAANLEGGWMRE